MTVWSAALQRDFDRELDCIALSAERSGVVEGVFRLRALLEISDALSTSALVELASTLAKVEPAAASDAMLPLRKAG